MTTAKPFDLIIVGGGIVGAAAFLKLQRRHPEARIALLEKEDILSDHQTGHNSGVIHSGLYYPPGSLKAINCVKGRHELVAFAKEYGVEHDICGKVVAAATADEVPMLEKVFGLGAQRQHEREHKVEGGSLFWRGRDIGRCMRFDVESTGGSGGFRGLQHCNTAGVVVSVFSDATVSGASGSSLSAAVFAAFWSLHNSTSQPR